jgi:hypothetical protein
METLIPYEQGESYGKHPTFTQLFYQTHPAGRDAFLEIKRNGIFFKALVFLVCGGLAAHGLCR